MKVKHTILWSLALTAGMRVLSAQAQLLQAGHVDAKIVNPEVTVIGWVNANAPDIVAAVNRGPSNPLLELDLNSLPQICLAQMFAWSIGIPSNLFSQRDADYANAWLLNNSGNSAPPSTISPQSQLSRGDFRLFNDFGGFKYKVQVGSTPIPCIHFKVGPVGQKSSYMGDTGTSPSGETFQLSEGRLGTTGQAVSETINDGRTVPWIWSVIEFDSSGNPTTSDHSMFPTFSVYKCDATTNTCSQTATYHQSPAAAFIARDQSYQRRPSDIQ